MTIRHATAAFGILLIASAAASAASAPRRASTTGMTCAQAKALVDRSGAIVLGTGGDTYERLVSLEVYCPTGYFARPAWEPTRDKAQCYVGYYCSTSPPFLMR